jgi:hypothetical protein
MKILRKLLADAEAAGHTMICQYDRTMQPDYCGKKASRALKALTACDEMHLTIRDRDNKSVGWALVIPGLEDDEVIADYSGVRLSHWMETNAP